MAAVVGYLRGTCLFALFLAFSFGTAFFAKKMSTNEKKDDTNTQKKKPPISVRLKQGLQKLNEFAVFNPEGKKRAFWDMFVYNSHSSSTISL